MTRSGEQTRLPENSGRLRFAFADPPYPGQSRRLYGNHPDYAGVSRPPTSMPENGPYVHLTAGVIDHLAAILWYEAGAVIAWEQADPEVQERYRARVRGVSDDR